MRERTGGKARRWSWRGAVRKKMREEGGEKVNPILGAERGDCLCLVQGWQKGGGLRGSFFLKTQVLEGLSLS